MEVFLLTVGLGALLIFVVLVQVESISQRRRLERLERAVRELNPGMHFPDQTAY